MRGAEQVAQAEQVHVEYKDNDGKQNNGGPKLPIYSFRTPAESDSSVKVKTINCDGEVRTVTPPSIGDNKISH